MNSKSEIIAGHRIYLNQKYYLAYAGGKREMTKKQESDWNKTLCLPEILKRKEQGKLGFDNNPNVIPVTGSELMSYIRELNFIPFFDSAFNGNPRENILGTHLLYLTDLIAYEAIRSRSYEAEIKRGAKII